MPDLPFAIEPNLYCSLDYYNILSHYSPLYRLNARDG